MPGGKIKIELNEHDLDVLYQALRDARAALPLNTAAYAKVKEVLDLYFDQGIIKGAIFELMYPEAKK